MKQSTLDRRNEAKVRNERWKSLTAIQQLQSLQARGHGHCKQALKLKEQLNEIQNQSQHRS